MRCIDAPHQGWEHPQLLAAIAGGIAMSAAETVEDLREAIKAGRIAIMRQRELLRRLLESDADQYAIDIIKTKLELLEEVHAEDVTQLRRLRLH